MYIRLFLLFSCLLFANGCLFNDEPMPQITEIVMPSENSAPAGKAYKTYIDKDIPGHWLPPSYLEDKKRWQGIVIHHSASSYGCAAHEHKYHKSIGWDGLGYQFVINNGVFRNGYGKPDGFVEVGYRWLKQEDGAHCKPSNQSSYWNKHTIGICLIGDFNKTKPTEKQWTSLVKLVRFLQYRYNIPTRRIKAHRDIKPTDCPGEYFSFAELRRRLQHHNNSNN